MIQPQPQALTAPPESGPKVVETYTVDLPPYGFGMNNRRKLHDVIQYSGGSAAGLSATTAFIGCPRYSELKALGVRPKSEGEELQGVRDLIPTEFGTMMHALRAERFVYGPQWMYWLLGQWQSELTNYDFWKAYQIWQLYDQVFPYGMDPFEILGVEVEVRTPLRLWNGSYVVKTVRYDTVIRYAGTRDVYSFECKTMSKSGESVLRPYFVQGMTHAGLWNANPWLVSKYGQMRGSIFDCLVKTKEPDVDRRPMYWTTYQQQRALLYLCSPQQSVHFVRSPVDGKMPEMYGHCYGHWSPCQYIGICHEQAFGMYEYEDGSAYDGR